MRKSAHGAFDCLRLLAALSVLFSHSFVLTGHATDPLMWLTGGIGFGEVAVYVFFAISGYLVTESWQRDPNIARFMVRRSLRIFPALIFVIVASFCILGPLVTRLSLPDYFSRPAAWTYLSKIVIYPAQYGLPGVFENNPYPNIVNGSLWTLRLEFGFYVVVALLGLAGLLRLRFVGVTVAVLCLLLSIAADANEGTFHSFTILHQAMTLFNNAVPFFIGAALAQGKLSSKWIPAAAIAGCIALVFLAGTAAFKPILLITLPLAVIFVAHYGHCDLSRFGDYSYGIYLWAFPVQQTVVHFMPGIEPLPLFFLSGIFVLVFAFLSWQFIEKRALAMKPRKKAA